MMIQENELTFKLAEFEGPLDLLLHLIRKNEMDIYDIQVSQITSQYLDYLHQMQTLQLDIAGEYLVTAAMLLNIKSRMLLPNEQTATDEQQEEFEDPREDLVQQLLLHQTFKMAAGQLRQYADERQKQYGREQAQMPEDTQLGQLDPNSLSVAKLQKAFARLLAKRKDLPQDQRTLQSERFTIEEEMEKITTRLKRASGYLEFSSFFIEDSSLEKMVTTFLALLELMKRNNVLAIQNDTFGPILMKWGKDVDC